jgi:CheY-like chemotaxis protein
MWEKVVLNLLSNAFKFTLDGPSRSACAAWRRHAVLTVQDTGTGIAAGDLPHLFERFHRVRGAGGPQLRRERHRLALVRELVRLHQGDVDVESALGQGSTFRVSIPTTFRQSPRRRRGRARPSAIVWPRLAGRGHGGGGVTLAAGRGRTTPSRPSRLAARPRASSSADDNADMRGVRGRPARAVSRVEAVGDGVGPWRDRSREPPDLLLADVMMPRLDGLELLRTIRADRVAAAAAGDLRVGAGRRGRPRRQAWRRAPDDYLVKPFGRPRAARPRRRRAEAGARPAHQRGALAVANRTSARPRRRARNAAGGHPRRHRHRARPRVPTRPGEPGVRDDARASGRAERVDDRARRRAPDRSSAILDPERPRAAGDELPLQGRRAQGRAVNDLELDVVHDDGRHRPAARVRGRAPRRRRASRAARSGRSSTSPTGGGPRSATRSWSRSTPRCAPPTTPPPS